MYSISLLLEDLLVSQQGFCSVELITFLIISSVNGEKLFQTGD